MYEYIRRFKKYVNKYNLIANKIINDEIKYDSTILIDVENNQFIIR